jgi:hypothetical protein
MKQTRKPQAQQASETALPPNEAALLDRFRRLKDKQQSFVLRSIGLLLMNESARPGRKAEHAMVAVKWRAQGNTPIKTIEQCAGIWENPTGMRFNLVEGFEGIPVAEADVPG